MARKRPPKVVLDTNVLLSALVFSRGPIAALRLAWQSGSVLPLVSRPTTEELIRVLAYPKFRLTPEEQQHLLGDYLPYTKVVKLPDPLPQVPACRDVLDLPFLHLALAGKADCLVTGDKDLLILSGQLACQIITPEQFMTSLAA